MVKKLDEQVKKNKKLRSFVVILAEDSDEAGGKLRALAEQQDIKKVPLTVFEGQAGPSRYKIAKEADVTVHLFASRKVKANHAFRAGELNDKAIEAIVADIPKILEAAEDDD